MKIVLILLLFLSPEITGILVREITLDYVTAYLYELDYHQLLLEYPDKDCRFKIQAKKTQAENLTTLYNRSCKEMFPHCIASSDCPGDVKKHLQIWNYEMERVNVKITFSESNFSLPFDLMDQIIVVEQQIVPKKLQTIMLTKQLASDYILPFNLLSQKAIIKIVIEQPIESIPDLVYTKQRFIETYWNQYGKDQILLSWLPYFSQCRQYPESQRLMLNNIISPYSMHLYSDGFRDDTVKFTVKDSYFSSQIKYQDKNIKLICLSEKIVGTVKKLQWYQNTISSLYYFFRKRITRQQYRQYMESDTLLAEINNQYYDKLIPLEYQPDYNQDHQTPNNFVLKLFVNDIEEFIQDSSETDDQSLDQCEIVKAIMTAYYSQSTQIRQQVVQLNNTSLVSLQINVVYLSNFQFLQKFMSSPQIYLVILLTLSIALVLVLYLVTRTIDRRMTVDFWILTKLILFPAFKGYIFAFSCNLFLIVYFYYLVSGTKFAAIPTSFDGKLLSSQDLELIYIGRLGLTILMAGYFLLSTAINQSFKVLTLEQAKIILEDASYQEQINKNSPPNYRPKPPPNFTLHSKQSPEQVTNEQQRRSFIIKNMNSHRKYLTLFILALVVCMISLREFLAQKEMELIVVYLLVGYSITQKVIVIIYRYYVVKEMLYLYSMLICYQAFSDFLMLFHVNFSSYVLISLGKIFVSHPLTLGLEVLCDYLAVRCHNYMQDCEASNQISCKYRLLAFFQHHIRQASSESKYQKTMYYTALVTVPMFAAFARIFIFIIYAMTLSYNHLCKNYSYSRNQFYAKGVAVSFAFLPLQIYILLTILKFFNYRVGLPAIKYLQFQHFKFMHRKINWINDCFIHNRCVTFFYREFEKFCQSSQMYLLSFMLVFSLNVMVIGFKIILEARYTMYSDPALLVIIIFVSSSINCFAMVLNFIAIKFKFYSRKEEFKMRARLENVEKILKISDYSEYLQVEAVKDYFLLHCKEWIVSNLTTILQPEDFIENNYHILSKYKHYKCLLKKRQIEKQRKQAKQQQKYEEKLTVAKQVHGIHHMSVEGNGEGAIEEGGSRAEGASSSKYQMQLANINNSRLQNKHPSLESRPSMLINHDIQSVPRNFKPSARIDANKLHRFGSSVRKGEDRTVLKMNRERSQQHQGRKIIKLPHQVFENTVKPLVYSWLSTAKQFVFLKKLIKHLKQQKAKQTCEFCSMNIELQALEKHDFAEIVNEYRLLNVGRPFIQHHFVNYYRFRQKYVTVCVECKERKLHVDRSTMEMSGMHAAILKKWIITARGRMLHREFNQRSRSLSMLKGHQD